MRKLTGKARLYRIAAHEAGHAVVSVLSTRALFGNDWGFDRVQIQRDRRKPIITVRHGPRKDCVGICEQSNLWNPGVSLQLLLGLQPNTPISPKLLNQLPPVMRNCALGSSGKSGATLLEAWRSLPVRACGQRYALTVLSFG